MNRRAPWILLVVAVVLAGCGSPQSKADRQAGEAADAKADALGRTMDRAAPDLHDPTKLAAQSLPGTGAEFLGIEDQAIRVRFSGHVNAHSSSGIGDDTLPAADVQRCYEYVLRPDGFGDPGWSRLDDCDERVALPAPELPVAQHLGDEAEDVVRTALGSSDDVAATLRADFPEGILVDVAEVQGWTGVGLFVEWPGDGCLLGRRGPDGTVEVWFPPAITVAPGENSCDGLTAAAGLAKLSPH